MRDIIIARIKYPNDPTGCLVPHQHFIGEVKDGIICLYTISSILGKENRVFGAEKENYEVIIGQVMADNGFATPSFIDCTKMYQIELDGSVNIELLSGRTISQDLVGKILSRIETKKQEGKHERYSIALEDFKLWNHKIVK